MPDLKKFETLEEAMRVLYKSVQPKPAKGSKHPSWGHGNRPDRDIRPARYDMSAINNIAKQIDKRIALTDRQQDLTIKLVTKYHKQWKKQGYDVSNINKKTPVELTLRTNVDRNHRVSVVNNEINLKFPYKPRLISQIADFGRHHACGKLGWNSDASVWEIAATSANIAWIDKFVSDHKFIPDQSYTDLIEIMNNAFDFNDIKLDIVDDKLVLNNAPATMLAWISENIGAIDLSNFVQIAASSNLLAFGLTDNIVKYTFAHHPGIANMLLMRRSLIDPAQLTFHEFLLRIKQLKYRNIAIFVTDTTLVHSYVTSVKIALPEYNIVVEGTCGEDPVECEKNIWITNRVPSVPAELIISFAGFMAGTSRRHWFNSATKNIYYCTDIDNKIKKQLKKDESNLNYKRRN